MIKELLQLIKQLFTWFVIVDPWELGVRTRLGRHQKNIGPGVHMRIPFFDRAYVQSVRKRMTVVPAMTLTTTDSKVVTVGAYLSFEIDDVAKLFNTLHDATDTIDAIAASVAAEYISGKASVELDHNEMQAYVTEHIELEEYGIRNGQYFIASFAVAKAYRFITGDIKTWSNTEGVDTTSQSGVKKE